MLDSMTKSMNGLVPFKWMDRDVFHEFRQKLSVEFDRGLLVVGCHPVEDEAVLGWALGDPSEASVVYVWVRKDLRHRGLGGAIYRELNAGDVFKTFAIQTRCVERYGLEEKTGLRYRPWPVFNDTGRIK